jgi:hypothetical protein
VIPSPFNLRCRLRALRDEVSKRPSTAKLNGEGGFPHSEIVGSKLAHSSPTLIAACHVLHRLCMPRHSPNALTSRLRVHTTNDRPDSSEEPSTYRHDADDFFLSLVNAPTDYPWRTTNNRPSRHRLKNPFTMSKCCAVHGTAIPSKRGWKLVSSYLERA